MTETLFTREDSSRLSELLDPQTQPQRRQPLRVPMRVTSASELRTPRRQPQRRFPIRPRSGQRSKIVKKYGALFVCCVLLGIVGAHLGGLDSPSTGVQKAAIAAKKAAPPATKANGAAPPVKAEAPPSKAPQPAFMPVKGIAVWAPASVAALKSSIEAIAAQDKIVGANGGNVFNPKYKGAYTPLAYLGAEVFSGGNSHFNHAQKYGVLPLPAPTGQRLAKEMGIKYQPYDLSTGLQLGMRFINEQILSGSIARAESNAPGYGDHQESGKAATAYPFVIPVPNGKLTCTQLRAKASGTAALAMDLVYAFYPTSPCQLQLDFAKFYRDWWNQKLKVNPLFNVYLQSPYYQALFAAGTAELKREGHLT